MRFSFGGPALSATFAAAAMFCSAWSAQARADVPESAAPLVTVAAHPLPPPDAPADQYFGKLKLSYLGVRNIIHAIAVEGNSPLALPLQRSRIMGVESAIAAWGNAYPRDTWLRGVMFSFAGVLEQKHDVDTDRIAIDVLLEASDRYSDSKWATTALARASSIRPASAIDWTIVPTFGPYFSLSPSSYIITLRHG